MKQFLKHFITGVLFFLMSVGCSCFGIAAYYGFSAVVNCTGWESVGLCLVSTLLTFLAGFLIYCMGLIPNDTVERLKCKITELEEKEYD